MPGLQKILPFIKQRLSIIVSGALAVFFLFLALQGIDWGEVGRTLLQVQVVYLILGLGISSLALLLRSLRWRNLLSARKSVPATLMFWITAIGYLGNTFLPARAGEILRSVVLGNKAGVSKSFVFATALTERVLDACVLVVTGVFLLPTLEHLPEQLKTFLWIIGPVSFLAFGCVIFAPALQGLLITLLTRFHMPEKWVAKISSFAEQFSSGAVAFVHPVRAAVFLMLTAVIWTLDGLGAVVLANGMGLTLHLTQAILFLIALGLSSALPSTPGYVGLYQITAVTVLPGFGFTRSQALTFVLVSQFLNIVCIAIWGILGLLQLDVTLSSSKQEPEV